MEGNETVTDHLHLFGRPDRLVRTVGVAVVLGAFGGLVTVGFLRGLDALVELLWTDLPNKLDLDSSSWTWIVPVVMVGAILLGAARRLLGEHPVSLEQSIQDHQSNGEFDYRHVWQAVVISLISLGFGAALGPEAALMAILGGLGSWIARVIEADERGRIGLPYVGIAAALGALFATAGASVLVLSSKSSAADDARAGRIWWLLPAVAASGAGVVVYQYLGTSTQYFDLGVPDYDFAILDLVWAVPVAFSGAALGVLFFVVQRLGDRLLSPFDGRHVLQSVLGGVVLAGLASWSTLILFSGHQGTDQIVADYGSDDASFLFLVAVGKVVAAAVLLSSKWKGGRFFPVMFAGAAVGLATTLRVDEVREVVGIAAGMTGAVGVLLRRPVIAVLFMCWFFPLNALPVVVVAAVVGGLTGRFLGAVVEDGSPNRRIPAA
ncbi:MAG: chloride channel protein [Ilumatobacter sp.]|nr:chloride channel protein [Ilumatobacter sp.]MDG2039063.1 chloride channel protein [Ilumatobacter sp.]